MSISISLFSCLPVLHDLSSAQKIHCAEAADLVTFTEEILN